ncbi:hypothetical protein AAVH_24918 [Aphelenchoides avenae]|nr:hypothetical protein AAVH_24918 [Aphelenchus avenae]
MLLPNDSFFVVLQFADYKTLVAAKLSGARFLRFVSKYAAELLFRRSFRVTFHNTYISYSDGTIGERLKRIRYEPANQQSRAVACRKLDRAIGSHAVANLVFSGSTLNMHGVGAVFEAAPALKHAESLDLYWPDSSTGGSTNSDAFLHNFDGMKTLRLSLDYKTFRLLSWSFLRKESARKLRLIKVSGRNPPTTGSMNASVKELVRYCVTMPHLQDGKPFELDISHNIFSGAFGVCSDGEFSFMGPTQRHRTRSDFPDVDSAVGARSDYSVAAGNYITRYASDNNGILVKAKGPLRGAGQDPCSVVIQRTAEVPGKKPRHE